MTRDEIKKQCHTKTLVFADGKTQAPIYDIDKCIDIMQRQIDQAKEDGELLAYNCQKRGYREAVNDTVVWLSNNPNRLSEPLANLIKDYAMAMNSNGKGMKTKREELYERWFNFDCECGSDHPATKKARQAYFDYCKEEDSAKQK